MEVSTKDKANKIQSLNVNLTVIMQGHLIRTLNTMQVVHWHFGWDLKRNENVMNIYEVKRKAQNYLKYWTCDHNIRALYFAHLCKYRVEEIGGKGICSTACTVQ